MPSRFRISCAARPYLTGTCPRGSRPGRCQPPYSWSHSVPSLDADGNFLYAYAFPDEDENGASTPVQITPQIGDQFTDYVQYYTFDSNDNPTYTYELSDDVFTWGEQGLTIRSVSTCPSFMWLRVR